MPHDRRQVGERERWLRCAAVPINNSSGSEALDRAAAEAIKRWRFIPARYGDEAVESWIRVPIDFSLAEVSGRTVINFNRANLPGGMVDFGGATFSGGKVSFRSTEFSGGRVDFDGATFYGGMIDLDDAEFSGGEVDFSSAGGSSFPPEFPWTGTPPPGVTLPKKEDQSQG